MGESAELTEREQKLQGLGTAMLRREDARFIRGQGTYIDDIKLPGMLMRAYRLLQENPKPSEQEIRYGMAGNLCRCTGYQNIVKAVQAAARKLAAAPAAA